MDKYIKYEELIKTLQQTRPVITEPEYVTDQIMKGLSNKKKVGDNVAWSFFLKARTIAAMAAVLLTGYFLYQQWAISYKINKLEQEADAYQSTPFTSNYLETIKAKYRESFAQTDFGTPVTDRFNFLGESAKIMHDKQSVNYLRKQYIKLRKGNVLMQKALLHK